MDNTTEMDTTFNYTLDPPSQYSTFNTNLVSNTSTPLTTLTSQETTLTSDEIAELRQSVLDERAFSINAQITLTVLYVLTIIFSVCGNGLVIIVLSLGKRSSHNLTRLLINLAAADIIMAVFCMPFTFVNVMLGR